MDALKVSARLSFTFLFAQKPAICQADIFCLRRLNLFLIDDFSLFVLLFLWNWYKGRCRMTVTERLVIVITVFHRLGGVAIAICYRRTHLSETIPENRLILIMTGIWFSALIQFGSSVPLSIYPVLIVKALKEAKPRPFQRFPCLMIVFIHLQIIGGSKILFMPKYLKLNASLLRYRGWIARQCSKIIDRNHSELHPCHPLMNPRITFGRRSASVCPRTGHTLPDLKRLVNRLLRRSISPAARSVWGSFHPETNQGFRRFWIWIFKYDLRVGFCIRPSIGRNRAE